MGKNCLPWVERRWKRQSLRHKCRVKSFDFTGNCIETALLYFKVDLAVISVFWILYRYSYIS